MIQITPQMRVLVGVEPADFRAGIDGLAARCRTVLEVDPFLCVVVRYVAGMVPGWGRAGGGQRIRCGRREMTRHITRALLYPAPEWFRRWTEVTTCWIPISSILEFSDRCAAGRSRATSTT